MELCECDVSDKFPIVYRIPVIRNLLGQHRLLVPGLCRIHLPVPQLQRHVLVHLVLEQLLHKLCPRILLLALLVDLLGKEHPALDIEQCRRHHEKLAHDIHILCLHVFDIVKILFCYHHDRYVIDIDLVFFDQIKKQIQRSLEHRKPHRQSHTIPPNFCIHSIFIYFTKNSEKLQCELLFEYIRQVLRRLHIVPPD